MKEHVLIVIKPDGMVKGLTGEVLNKLFHPQLELVAAKVARPRRQLVEQHYDHIKGTPFYEGVIQYLLGERHRTSRVLALVYAGEDAVRRCRAIAGDTNPEKAAPTTIRGAFGRITTSGLYENVVHVSSDPADALREIRLWFRPEELSEQGVVLKDL